MPAAIPLAVAAVGAGGSASVANQQSKAAKGAANSQNALAAQQMAQAQAEKDRWYGQLTPEIAAYKDMANKRVISPELTDSMYNFFRDNVDQQAAIDRTKLVQGLERRGLRDSGIAGRSLSDFAKGQADVKTGYGLNLAKDAALTNYNAQNQARQYLLSLMMSGYGGGQSAVNQSNQIGAGLQSDALAAQLAANQNRYGSYASALGGLASGAGQSYANWAASRPSSTVYQPAGGSIYDAPIGPTMDPNASGFYGM